MKKAFFINGGAGRVLCAIPALEYYVKNTDPTAVIVVEGWIDLYLTSKILANNVYPAHDSNLFEKLKDREIITPEPYKLNAYFTQRCNLVQAFDMLINYDVPPETIPETKEYNIFIGKKDIATANELVNEARNHFKKQQVVIFQPFGKTAGFQGNTIIDESGRSFEVDDIIKIIEELNKNYAVIMMSELKIPTNKALGVMVPESVSLLQWTGIINAADYFLGCDSVGQHIAHALKKPGTVVIGSTFPENISYPSSSTLTIIDNGKDERRYSPIRIVTDIRIDRHNENLMVLTDETIKTITKGIKTTLSKTAKPYVEPKQSSGCSIPGCD
jgi:hypothetical protein